MSNINIFFCNRTYNKSWLEDISKSNGIQYKIIQAIIEGIKKSDGGIIARETVIGYDPDVAEYVDRRKFKIIPSGGQELTRNGEGIYHAKFAPSKSVAVLWEKIRDVIFITFDDHAPVRYHRAIHSFHQLRLGRQVFPMSPRSSRKIMEIFYSKKPWRYKGINLKKKNYF